jgi:Chitobiase/beta-hexosaminidase C-terminal domain/Legume lectin domain
MYEGRTLKGFNTLAALIAMVMLGVCKVASAGATLAFSYPSGFAGSSKGIFLVSNAPQSGSNLVLTAPPETHGGGAAWYIAQQNIQAFTTQFTFSITPAVTSVPATAAMAFVVQNSNGTTNPDYGPPYYVASGDANVGGYGSYSLAVNSSQYPIGNAIAIKFDISGSGETNWPSGGHPNSTGLYIDGGPYATMIAANDLNPYGVNLNLGHVMACTIVYDGSLLTMVLKDTVTNAQARFSWPINIPAAAQGNSAWVGFTAGMVNAPLAQAVHTWSYWTGYNPRLGTPTFSVTPGSYTSAQSVSISGPSGASIYYTTNGLQPTSSSTPYTGPITVSSNEVIQAVAIQSGYTDSLVAAANYQIAPANTPIVNFASGFSSASGLVIPVGRAIFSGSNIQLTDTTAVNVGEAGAAWYAVPVNVQTFTTDFTLQFTNAQGNGMTFCIQNQPSTNPTPAYAINVGGSYVGGSYISGGPTAFGHYGRALGYGYIPSGVGTGTTGGLLNSVAVTFNLTDNGTGLYTNGALPTGADATITGVTLTSGNPLNVKLAYNGTALTMTITDTKTKASFSKSWAINIPATVGGSTAYVGFTGATGGQLANQDVLSWTYSSSTVNSPAVPAAPTNLRVQ